MAEESEILIGVDLPLGEVAAELSRVLGAVVEPDTGEYLVRVGGRLLGFLAEDTPGATYTLDITETGKNDDAQDRAAEVFRVLSDRTGWALTIGADDDTTPTLTRAGR